MDLKGKQVRTIHRYNWSGEGDPTLGAAQNTDIAEMWKNDAIPQTRKSHGLHPKEGRCWPN